MSFHIRPIAMADFSGLMEVAVAVAPGMTSMPPEEPALRAKIERSLAAFAGASFEECPSFTLAAFDDATGRLLGVSGVSANAGGRTGFVEFELIEQRRSSKDVGIVRETRALMLVEGLRGATYLGSLALHPAARGMGVGKALSLGRFFLIHRLGELFRDPIVSEIRGWQDQHGANPFYEGVAKPFIGLEFADADRLCFTHGVDFILNLMPRTPIYLDHLPEIVRAVVGKPHDGALPAQRILEGQGLRAGRYIDVFDGGPILEGVKAGVAALGAIRPAAELETASLWTNDRSDEGFAITIHRAADSAWGLPD